MTAATREGHVALVTGAAGGIGEAICRRLSEAGATVLVADVDVARARQVADAVGGRALRLDVGDEDGWTSVVADIEKHHGRLDVVALNAGVMSRPRGAPALDDALPWLTPAAYRRVSRVNVDGVVLGVLASIGLVGRHGGAIVVTASIAGLQPYAGDPFYAMTKHAVVGLVRSMGVPLAARGVRLVAMCPGGVDTGLTPSDLREQWEATPVDLAPPTLIADGFMHVLDVAAPGSVWLARPEDEALWAHESTLTPLPRES